MRCKNCGSENNDNLYICQNCGSPLYDEDEPVADSGSTQVFSVPGAEDGKTPQQPGDDGRFDEDEAERKEKQQKTVIAVLAVVLALIIIGTVTAVMLMRQKNEPETTTDTSVSETVTEESTEATKQQTTESTTEETTESTTKSTTEEKVFTVTVSANEGGSYDGGGSYKLGENATVRATADEGYEFDGWYEGSTRVSSNAAYTFTVTEDKNLKAVFRIVDVAPSDEGIDEGVIDGDDFN